MTVSAQVAYDLLNSRDVVLLNINQCVHVPTTENNILFPMQLQMNGCRLQDTPKFQVGAPTENDHSVTINSESGDKIRIPFRPRGVTSYFPTRKPTPDDRENTLDKYNLAVINPNWDPHDTHYEDQDNLYLDQHDCFQIPPMGGGSVFFRPVTRRTTLTIIEINRQSQIEIHSVKLSCRRSVSH